jgi:hypothetical protein
MGVIIILFFISIVLAFGMLYFRAWEIKTSQAKPPIALRKLIPEVYFRHVEKIMLHLAKYAIQWVVLMVVKYWFIVYTKSKNWGVKNWPKLYNFFKKRPEGITDPQKYTFIQRAKLELKAKIRHTREKVRREHEEESPDTNPQI